MVLNHDLLANFKFWIILTSLLVHVLISLMHFFELFGMVLPLFVKFLQNCISFNGAMIPIVVVKVR